MRYPTEDTEKRHSKLVEKAAEMIREHGVDGVSVSKAMQAAGLTHGAFYSHFDSKTDLVRAAIEHGMEATRRGVEERAGTSKARAAYTDRYLSMEHRENLAGGCTMASLCGELRDRPELQDAFTGKFKEILATMGGNREEAMARVAMMVGALSLSRAMNDDALAEQMLQATRKELKRKL